MADPTTSNSASGKPAREVAVDLLDQVTGQGRLMSELASFPALQALPPQDRARAHRLALETLRGIERADRLLEPHLRKNPPLRVRNLLRLATVELCTGGAGHGIVNEAVNITAKARKTKHLKGLVNAVLRKIGEDGPDAWGKMRIPRMPDWLRGPLAEAYGKDVMSAIEAAHFQGAPVDLSCKSDPEKWAETLGGTVLPTGSVRLSKPGQITALAGYETGDWWVQDAAAAMPAKILNAQNGEQVLDMCAAPGGKTMQMANAGAQVTALDISENRMGRVRENLARTKLGADLVVGDGLDHQGQYDAILLDAPCSATGTMRRHPDLPFAKDGSEFGGLIELQSAMLDHALGLLKPGGRLVYCTCSLLPDEGECQIDEALERHPDLKTVAPEADWIDPSWRTSEGGLRLRPDFWNDLGGMDGFYIAVLAKAG